MSNSRAQLHGHSLTLEQISIEAKAALHFISVIFEFILAILILNGLASFY